MMFWEWKSELWWIMMVMVVFIVGKQISNRILVMYLARKVALIPIVMIFPEFNNEMKKDQDNQQEFLE